MHKRLVLVAAMFIAAPIIPLAAAAERATPGGRALPAGKADRPKNDPADPNWNQFEQVFTGKLDQVVAGPVGQSFPPMYTHRLQFTVEKTLRGTLKAGERVTCSHVARQHQAPQFPEGKVCLVAASQDRGQLRVETIELADAKTVAAAELACALPLGWRNEQGKAVSPWAALGKKAWQVAEGPKGDVLCSQTGRPALLCREGIRFEVEHVPPAKDIQWTNPDGDGEYKISVTNTSDQPQPVPALLTDGKRILWEESLVILCQDKTYACPGCEGVSGKVESVRLKPGESVSGVVNALRLEGPDWPKGGYRIEFRFCLGEKSQTKSFYYMSRHHDKLREAATKSAANGGAGNSE
jgi:hypothetical protein